MKNFLNKLAASNKLPVYLVYGRDPIGLRCYYYIISSEKRIRQLNMIKNDVFNINDYGKVILSGFGEKPTENEINYIERQYSLKQIN